MQKVILLIATFLCALLIPPVAFAQDGSLSEIGSYTDDARAARVTKLRETYRITLSDKERELVVSRCKGAQGALSKILERLKTTRFEREKTYTSVISALANLKLRFENAHTDASNLDLLIVTYQQKSTGFRLSAGEYETTLEDVIRVDCVFDPVGFRAALEGVRSARKDIVGISSDITETTKSTLPTTFDSLKLRLSTDGETSGE